MNHKYREHLRKVYCGILAMLVLCTLFFVLQFVHISPIHAYLEDREEIVNSMVIGENEIIPEEAFETPVRGKKTVKEPKVKNTGTVDCYVRAKVLVSDSRALDYFTYYDDENFGFHTEDWITEEDGWIYYKNILKPGESSSPIFTHILLSNNIPDHLLGFSIDIVFESVQTEHFLNSKDAFLATYKGGILSESEKD